MSSTVSTIYEFEDFRLIPSEGLLLRNSVRVELNPKAFGVLVMLVERNGHLLSRSEIMDAVWEEAFIEEGAISKAVWFIRNALGDTSKERFIQTVPRRGYRFVAPVRVLNDPTAGEPAAEFVSSGYRLPTTSPDIAAEPAAPELRLEEISIASAGEAPSEHGSMHEADPVVQERADRRPRLTTYVGFALLLVAAIGIYLSFGGSGILGRGGTSRIAIVPIKPMDAGTRDTGYELGIADSLIMKLSASPNLRVTHLSAVRGYAAVDDDPIKIGKEQSVDFVLCSHYQLANGRIKVTSQLYDVSTGRVEDTFTAENDATHLFAAQKSIADDIGDGLLARFDSSRIELRTKRATDNEEAYRYYQLAMNLSEERGVQNLMKSLEYLESALAADPNYALAWAAKAHIHRDIVGHTDSDQTLHYQKSMEAVERALAIDPLLSDAYSAICQNKLRYEYDVRGAESACKKAVDLDPNSPLAHKSYARFLYPRGRFDEALSEIRIAMDHQPVSYRNQQIYGLILHFARRYGEAEQQFMRLLELNPNHTYIHGRLVRIFEEQGKEDKAFEYFIKMRKLQNAESQELEDLRSTYENGGWRAVRLEAIKAAEAAPEPKHYLLACQYAMAGNKDKALMSLEKAFEDRSFMIAVIQVEPQLDSLREDPRFAAFLKKVGLPPI